MVDGGYEELPHHRETQDPAVGVRGGFLEEGVPEPRCEGGGGPAGSKAVGWWWQHAEHSGDQGE